MEIERKFLIEQLPANLDLSIYPQKEIQQGYLSTSPVVRIRKSNDKYILTYKGEGLLSREEHNLALTKESFEHLKSKIDGILIEKTRYVIPYMDKFIELDIFKNSLAPLMLAEIEFSSEEEALSSPVPTWFSREVTYEQTYHNSTLSQRL